MMNWNNLIACGNGVTEYNEQCDDQNNAGFDGCNANCVIEPGYVCNNTAVSVCQSK